MRKEEPFPLSRRIWPAVAGILAFVVFAGSMVFWYVSTAGHSDGEALSTTFVSQSQATDGELLTMDQEQDKVPDYSSPAALAISISWPLYEGGAKANPKSLPGSSVTTLSLQPC